MKHVAWDKSEFFVVSDGRGYLGMYIVNYRGIAQPAAWYRGWNFNLYL